MINYNNILSECVKEGAIPFAEQINGGMAGGDAFCFLYFERQAKKYERSEFITNGEFYSMCLIMAKSYKSSLLENNETDLLLRNDILPIIENALTVLISQLKPENKISFADYLTCEDKNKNKMIEKIRKADRNTPKSIYIILKALFDNGLLTMNNNETIYKVYHAEFGYHKSYETLKRGLNHYDIDKPDTENQQKIGNMYEYLTS